MVEATNEQADMKLVKADKQVRARKWVNGYMAAGSAIVIAAIIPGSTSAALCTMEAHMCYQIGKIYLGERYSFKEATSAARAIGLAAITGKLLAMEALNFAPGLGTFAKAGVAGGVIKALGEAIIKYYEQQETKRREIIDTEVVIEAEIVRSTPPALPPPLPPALPAPSTNVKPAIEERLRKLSELLQRNLISQTQYETKKQRIIDEL